jgi:hypothetical protein
MPRNGVLRSTTLPRLPGPLDTYWGSVTVLATVKETEAALLKTDADVSTHHLPVMPAAQAVTVIHRMAKSAKTDFLITVMMTAGIPGVTTSCPHCDDVMLIDS